ncbi:MFS transporter [Streptomyces sp. NBC_01210]|uniref:MFS transporter n=1 Tax=Streptomyces sp. NBC_01210 TaxID=2903774 RepID=UPI002E13D656|nr:MFS transporter [Streptomyces sp. NBC_01210]
MRRQLTREQGLYLLANLIDNIGSGLWAPMALIFFTRAQHLPIEQVGTALTAGGFIGLLAGPLGGNLVDRWGPTPFVVLGNVARAGVCALYPLVGSAWHVGLLTVVFTASERVFWTANAPMLGRLVREGELTRAFGLLGVFRLVGLGAGAGLGAALSGLLIDDVRGLRLVTYANAVSYLVAAALVLAVGQAVRGAAVTADHGDAAPPSGAGWRVLLADRPYLLLCLLQVQFTLATQSLVVILPVVALDILHGPSWLPGVLVIVACGCLVLAREPALRYGERRSRTHSLRLSCLAFALAFLLLVPAAWLDVQWAVPVALAAAVAGGVGEALYAPVTIAMANEAAPEALKGRYSAVFQTAFGLAGALGPALFTGLLTAGNSVLWLALAGISLLSAPAVSRVTRALPALPVLGTAQPVERKGA